MAMPSPSRNSDFGGLIPSAPNRLLSPPVSSTPDQSEIALGTFAQGRHSDLKRYQTFAAKKDVLMKREKDMKNSIAHLNQFLEEAMFLVNNCSERLAARDERIHDLMAENADLKRKLKE
ncbi:unnamed protein product [Rodentolepis nana]|uniref:BZIP domain-containing protein n=1 Tax=Rodentolepis nana TaxID=102285 RepID=A0A0R3TIP3_RODNA|nr:unnamed protein product [Rodentolepis nana]